jgi:hypothetical protein
MCVCVHVCLCKNSTLATITLNNREKKLENERHAIRRPPKTVFFFAAITARAYHRGSCSERERRKRRKKIKFVCTVAESAERRVAIYPIQLAWI